MARDDGAPTHIPTNPATNLPKLPNGWPTVLKIGASDSPGGATEAAAKGLGFRYQYLAGGVNTGNGWDGWAPDGSFVSNYIDESERGGLIPVFSYYMIRQSEPGVTMPEPEGVKANLDNPETMRAMYRDLELFFKRAAATGTAPIVLHFEPDLWGYIQQRARDDDASTVPVAVASSGFPGISDLPNTATGMAEALLRLRDSHAPGVLVAYHMSFWGPGTDPIYADPSMAELDELSARSVKFYQSLRADFDLAFAEMSDRDAGFKHNVYGDGGVSWWDESDFERHVRYLRQFVLGSGLRVVLWQIPLGNTKMRALNNTWNHYQDNKVEWLLGQASPSRMQPYLEAGMIGLLFGRGADGATCACDAARDGTTNPAPINGNSGVSTSGDDDGGYFHDRLREFVRGASFPLPK